MKLSDRFSRLDGLSNKHYSAASYGGGGRSVAPPDLSGAYGGMMSNRFVESRSFLFDDYMGNDLHGTGRVDQHTSSFRLNNGGGGGGGQKSRGSGGYRNFSNGYVDLDDDGYEAYETRAPRVGRPSGRADLAGETRYVMVPVDSVRPRRRQPPRARAETVQEVYEYYEPLPRPARQGRPKIVKKVPIQNRVSFKRQPRALRPASGHNAGLRQTPTKKQKGGSGGYANRRKSFVKGRINKTRPPLKKKRPETRPKVTVEELNRELDTYMRSGKHPRIEPISA